LVNIVVINFFFFFFFFIKGYELSYGSAPADYSIHGEPGGLSRIDTILGLDLYGSTFGNSPLVFGAFPSLHSGCATFEMLFLVYLCPRLKPLAIFYVLWMWFSTMYLTHHYMIDLVGGSIYAILTFVVAQKFLPQVNPDARTRLDYLGISKLSFVNFFKSIESDPYDIRAQKIDDEEALTKYTIPMSNRPEPLRLSALLIEKQQRDEECQSPALSTASASSSHYWSEPSSPITPHSPPVLNHFGNHKD
jgi:hypothetical protein